MVAVGVALESIVIAVWIRGAFGPMLEPRRSVLGMLAIGVGTEIAVFSFVHAVLRKHVGARASDRYRTRHDQALSKSAEPS